MNEHRVVPASSEELPSLNSAPVTSPTCSGVSTVHGSKSAGSVTASPAAATSFSSASPAPASFSSPAPSSG